MKDYKNNEVPYHLILLLVFSSVITILMSTIYVILCILAIVYRFNCDVGSLDTIAGSNFFMATIYRSYIQKDDCDHSLQWVGLTQADTVFVLNITTLLASLLCLAAAIVVMTCTFIKNGNKTPQIHLAAYVYVGVCLISFIVDVTYATHFAMDYTYMNDQMNLSNAGLPFNYERDMVRLGALFLISVCFKGYVAHAINLILMALIVVYVRDNEKLRQKDQHPTSKIGPLHAYVPQSDPASGSTFTISSRREVISEVADLTRLQAKPGGLHGDDLASQRKDFSRSQSWQAAPLNDQSPFTYLEAPKRDPKATRPPPSTAASEEWRRNRIRNWSPSPPAPPVVPEPDYSPHAPRRLKSALKNTYI